MEWRNKSLLKCKLKAMDLLPDLSSCLGNADLWILIPCLCLLEQWVVLFHICPWLFNFFRKLFPINMEYLCSQKTSRCLWKKTRWTQSMRKIFRLHIQFKVEFGTVVCPYRVLFGIQVVRETKAKWHIPTTNWDSSIQNGNKCKRAFSIVFTELSCI